jgi:hypothetical protein
MEKPQMEAGSVTWKDIIPPARLRTFISCYLFLAYHRNSKDLMLVLSCAFSYKKCVHTH